MAFHSIVHFDLKGAPWKIEYICKVLSFMKYNGAWGVLLEWEDTFPYTSELADIGSHRGSNRDGLYSIEDIKHILRFVKITGMVAIQLVQTMGHMEFVLKHDSFSHLRELPHSPAVLCPSRPGSLALVQTMIRQVMEVQPDAPYLHIGADEVWHMNQCAECQRRARASEHGAIALYLEHVRAVASFVHDTYPGVKVLLWDDMLRTVPVHVLKAYKLGSLVQPVVWNYNIKEHFKFDPLMWGRYSMVFPKLWAASAYKGANGSCQMLPSIERYTNNQLAWRDEMNVWKREVTFSGIILTGWSRFDHYATLCELLPVTLPTLVSCLRMWSQPDGFTNESNISDTLPLHRWWGHEVAVAVKAAFELRTRTLTFLHGDQVVTWLNQWQLEHGYTSPLQAENILLNAKQLSSEYEWIRRTLSARLLHVTGRRSTEEVLQTWLTPVEKQLGDLVVTAATRAQAPAGVTPRSTNEAENV